MASEKASLWIELRDAASSGIERLKGSLSSFRASWLAVAGAVAGVTAAIISSVKAYAEQETANNKLNVALKNQGTYTAQVAKDLQDYAGQLQRTTTFTDENIVEQMALLTTFGLSGKALKDTTAAALDLSKGLGVDLRTATMMLGKAASGETGTLQRYGITIDEGIPKAEKFSAVLDQVNARFGGSAQAAVGTMAGKIENLSNRMGDLKERIGAQLVPVVEWWANKLEKVVGWLEKLDIATQTDLTGRELTIQKMREEMAALIEKSTLEGTYHEETIQRRIQNYEDAIMREQQKLEQERQSEATRTQIAAQEKARKDKAAAEDKARDTAAATAKVTTTKKQNLDLDKAMDQWIANEAARQKRQTEIEKAEQETRKSNLSSTLSYIATLSEAKSKELRAVGKAAAISQATIDTFAGAAKALGSAPPPYNFVLMAAVIAAGMANVARISGVALAQGGIVLPQPGGVQATIGEAGYPEAVIPLNDERAAGMMGGGETHYHFNIGTLVADRHGIQELAQKIDEELYRMTINRRSVAL